MGILSLLTNTLHFGQVVEPTLKGVGWLTGKLIEGIASISPAIIGVGLGIIIFSLILKLIVLPFDIIQRVNMRKQNVKMQENKEKFEKLQKQYANDKQKYNEQMMEFQKANGLSLLSSCLPMIMSMVVFIVAIRGFNNYSQFSNIQNYNDLAGAYTAQVEEYMAYPNLNLAEGETDTCTVTLSADKKILTVTDSINEKKCIYLTINYNEKVLNKDGQEITTAEVYPEADNNKLKEYVVAAIKGELYDSGTKARLSLNLTIDYEKVLSYDADLKKVIDDYIASEEYKGIQATGEVGDENYVSAEDNKQSALNAKGEAVARQYIKEQARDAAALKYEEIKDHRGFLWIKNIWDPDVAWRKAVNYKSIASDNKFLKNATKITDVYSEEAFNEITSNVSVKNKANGYFILVLFSIGTILLQQLITMKSQKAQNQFSSVDGQSGKTSKMTMFMMTGMFAFFSFMYSAAFSLYMITSNIVSLLSTLIINKVVDTIMNKKEAAAFQEKHAMKNPSKVKEVKVKKEKKDKK